MEKDNSEYIYIFKFLCILSVISAHSQISLGYNDTLFALFEKVLSSFGCLGVAGFFILSGYFFSHNKRKFKEFWKRKVKQLLVPWIVWGGINNILSVIVSNKNISPYNILFGWVGAYYIVNLLIFYLIFWKLKNKKILKICFILSILSQILYAVFKSKMNLNAYFVFPIWANWFILGLLLKDKINYIIYFTKKYKNILLFVLIITIIIGTLINIDYWCIYFILVALSGLLGLCGLAHYLQKTNLLKKQIIDIGKNTMLIMFNNFYITVLISKILMLTKITILILLAPILTISVEYIAIQCLKLLPIKKYIKDKLYIILGVKNLNYL